MNQVIVQLPFKDDIRPAVNYRTARGQLNHLVQHAQNDEQFGQQYYAVVNSYVEKDFIEQVPNHPVEGHYMPHHAVFKKSATTPLRIVFNASSNLVPCTLKNFSRPSFCSKRQLQKASS